MLLHVDTDVVLLAVYTAHYLVLEYKLWLAFGTSKNLRYFAAHKIASGLGQKMAQTLMLLLAATLCLVS